MHRGGTYVVIEGPAFSTRAESHLYRSWGASVIGMTALPEAKLAREAELCYVVLACATDYDVWRESEEDVSVEMVVAALLQQRGDVAADPAPPHPAAHRRAGLPVRDGAAQRNHHRPRRHPGRSAGAPGAASWREQTPARQEVLRLRRLEP